MFCDHYVAGYGCELDHPVLLLLHPYQHQQRDLMEESRNVNHSTSAKEVEHADRNSNVGHFGDQHANIRLPLQLNGNNI